MANKTIECLCGHEQDYEIIVEENPPRYPYSYECRACQSIMFHHEKLKEKTK